MKLKKILAVIIAVAVFAAVLAMIVNSAEPVVIPGEVPEEDTYISKSGVITQISEYLGITRLTIEPHDPQYDEETFVFMISEDTVFLQGDMDSLVVGANVTGKFDGLQPMTMIYPPHYNIQYLTVGGYAEAVPPLYALRDGETAADGYAEAVPPLHVLTDEERRTMNQAFEGAFIRVDGETLTNRAFVSDSGYIMVPVREIAEALGHEVTWFGDTRTVQVGFVSFTLDYDAYAFARMAPMPLGQAPVLKNSLTHVPIDLFTSPYLGAMTPGWTAEYCEEREAMLIDILTDSE